MTARRLLVVAACLFVAAAAAPSSASAAALSNNLRGIQILNTDPTVGAGTVDADIQAAAAVGARVIRSELRWAALEPSPGRYDDAYVASVDHLFAAARAAQMKVFLTIVGTPCWTSIAPGADCDTPQGREAASHWQPSDFGAFARAAAFAAQRWQPGLAAIELWNEPDQRNELYWRGDGKVQNYADLVKAAYPAIKAAAPGVQVAAGGIVGSDGRFLKALYAAGMKGSYDTLSVHFYDLTLLALNRIRNARRTAGDTAPMWLAEYGYDSCLGRKLKSQDAHVCKDPRTQAADVVDVLRSLKSQRDLAGAILYALRDNPQYDFGIYDAGGRRKPLFARLRNAFAGRFGSQRRIRLKLRASKGRIVASGSGPAGDAFVLTVRKGGVLRYRAVLRTDRYDRYSVKLPTQLGTHGMTVRMARYSAGGRAAVARS